MAKRSATPKKAATKKKALTFKTLTEATDAIGKMSAGVYVATVGGKKVEVTKC